MTLDELKSLLSRFRIKPSQKLGQNFLLSEDVLDQIVKAGNLSKDDMVYEIGPGLGALTRRLSEKAGLVLAVEKDRKLVAALRKLFKSKKNVKIISGDALFFDWDTRGPETEGGIAETAPRPYKVVANIPYYITGKLLRTLLASDQHTKTEKGVLENGATATTLNQPSTRRPSLIVLLLQKETAERIIATPGEMSLLSVSTQLYADAEIVGYVERKNFYPVPEVDSAILRLRVLPGPRLDVDEKKFFQVIKVGFANKRKQLHNNLSVLFGKQFDFKKMFQELGLPETVRAQELSLKDWEEIYKQLNNLSQLSD